MQQVIYADHAATTKLDADAFEAMRPFLLEAYANASQPYALARAPRKALQEARETIAACVNAVPEEIFFTSGGTESDNWAIKGSMSHGDPRGVITSAFEHHAVLHACQRVASFGYPVAYLQPSQDGFITPENLAVSLSKRAKETRLVSVMLVNNEIGTIQPVQALSAIAHQYGATFHTDAVQAPGHIPVDVKALGADLLSCSAHKFNGPKGIGFLFVKKGTPLSPYADGGSQEFGMRAGTENVAAIVGMAVALQKSIDQMEESRRKLLLLEETLLGRLHAAEIPFRRNGTVPQIPGNLSLSFCGIDGEALLHRLDLQGIMISTGSACNGKDTQLSHVLQAIKADETYAKGTVRISLGKDNTLHEAEAIATAIIGVMRKKSSRTR